MYFVISQCFIVKMLGLVWMKLDVEIMCTLNEYFMGYMLESSQCLINPDLMTQWYIVEAVLLTVRTIIDIYFAFKLY